MERTKIWMWWYSYVLHAFKTLSEYTNILFHIYFFHFILYISYIISPLVTIHIIFLETLLQTPLLSKCTLPCTFRKLDTKKPSNEKEGKAISATCNCGSKYEWNSDPQQRKSRHCGKIWFWIEQKWITFCFFTFT